MITLRVKISGKLRSVTGHQRTWWISQQAVVPCIAVSSVATVRLPVWIQTRLLLSSCLLKCGCRSSSGWPSLTFHRRKPYSSIQISDFLLRGQRRWSGTWTLEVGKVARPQAPTLQLVTLRVWAWKWNWRRSYTADPTTEWWQVFAEFTQLFVCSWMKFCFADKDK